MRKIIQMYPGNESLTVVYHREQCH